MAKKVLLTSDEELKEESIIEENVDSKLLAKTIEMVQNIQLRSVLGENLYKSIIDAAYNFKNNNVPLSASNAELLYDYIKPFLNMAVACEFIIVNNYKLTNKGVLKLRDDLGEAVSATELETAKNFFEQYKAEYKRILIEYLQEKNLIDCADNNDTDTTIESTGWYLIDK